MAIGEMVAEAEQRGADAMIGVDVLRARSARGK
jgi:uncharacterized protein YbjQ (UPF0145 family)